MQIQRAHSTDENPAHNLPLPRCLLRSQPLPLWRKQRPLQSTAQRASVDSPARVVWECGVLKGVSGGGEGQLRGVSLFCTADTNVWALSATLSPLR